MEEKKEEIKKEAVEPAKEEVKEKKEEKKEIPGWYKGYDVRWLKKEKSHPHYHYVAEYEAIHGEIK